MPTPRRKSVKKTIAKATGQKPKRRTVEKKTTGENDLFNPTVTTKRVVKRRKNKPTVTKTKTTSSTRASSGVTKQKTKTVGGKVVKSKTTTNYEGRVMSKKDMKKRQKKYTSSYAKQFLDMGPTGPKKTKTVSKQGGNYTVSKTRRKADGSTVTKSKVVTPKRGQRVMTRRTR